MSLPLGIQARVMLAAVALEPCCLCGGPSNGAGIFEPGAGESHLYGVPEGKQRWCFYSLCRSCQGEADAFDRVEAHLQTLCRGVR